jgi:hypothetical protein
VLHVRIEYKCPTAYVQLDAMTTAGLELVSDARGREREKERKNERRERERKKERRAREREKEREREISFGTELSECACVQYSKFEKGRGQRAHDRELHRRTAGSYWRHLTCRALTVYIKI